MLGNLKLNKFELLGGMTHHNLKENNLCFCKNDVLKCILNNPSLNCSYCISISELSWFIKVERNRERYSNNLSKSYRKSFC